MLRGSDVSYYVDSTKRAIEARVWEHNNFPLDSYITSRRPAVFVFAETYDSIIDAVARGSARARGSLGARRRR